MRERRPNRMPRFDYSSRGAYFLTTNVKHRAEWFGRVRDGRMVLNADGLIAHRCWMEIPEHFPGVRVDAFVVMPDHVHGIIIIDDASVPGDGRDFLVGARHAWPLPNSPNHAIIPVVVGSYKSAVSKLVHRFGSSSFQWQRSYHDTVIRDHGALQGIRRYIGENPARRGGVRCVRGVDMWRDRLDRRYVRYYRNAAGRSARHDRWGILRVWETGLPAEWSCPRRVSGGAHDFKGRFSR